MRPIVMKFSRGDYMIGYVTPRLSTSTTGKMINSIYSIFMTHTILQHPSYYMLLSKIPNKYNCNKRPV